jgi:excinuclease ABC subunit A
MYNYPDMLKQPFEKLPADIQKVLLYGTGEKPLEFHYTMRGKKYLWSKPFEGILENLRRRMIETESDSVRDRLKTLLTNVECPVCKGARLNKWSLAVKVGGLAINEFNALSVEKALDFVNNLQLEGEAAIIAADILKEIRNRLSFLKNVGLNYLTLDRVSGTLSGGEAQRIRLATQLGCGLVGVLYILDEPSIGLHQRDNDKLLDTLVNLKNIGNTVLVVEHDLDTIKKADYVLDLGPGAGAHGGEIVAMGKSDEIPNFPKSLTGDFLAGRLKIDVPTERQKGNGKFLAIKKAEHNNLKKVDVQIPLGTFTCVTGVSGSGKSSLINGILVKALNKHQKIKDSPMGKCKEVSGLNNIDKAIIIDQTPIGRTPRSNPVTYTDAFSMIRNLFASLPDSKVRGFTPGRFSFNVKGGRCEDCKGDGIKKIEMQFLSDVYVECSSCHGKRFNQETLNIRYKKKNIADILDMTIDESVEFFDSIPALKRKLGTLQSVGLGYVKLGQSATTLSGGEAQRIKLAAELSKIPKGHTVYILDEPTTGLHLADIKQLLKVLMKLRDKGNTVIVIEHNLDVIKCADHIIDMGPEGGDNGGQVIAEGTPEEVAKIKKSYTGKYLKEYLQ